MNISQELTELVLAKEICSCPLVTNSLKDGKHPCSKIVKLQAGDTSSNSDRQRPEPWMGNLGQSKILFISSNPSINDEVIPFRENFPTYQWDEELSASFFTTRVGQHVTFNHPTLPNFITRSMDGQYRNGLKRPLVPQYTWKKIHERAKELLGDVADPSRNYALTEVVHCKSRNEEGVKEAGPVCIDMWMDRILKESPARILVIVGGKVRDAFAKPKLGVTENFGSGKHYAKMTQLGRALRDIQVIGGSSDRRIVIFNYHPAAREGQFPQKYLILFGEEIVAWLQNIANGKLNIPDTREELSETLVTIYGK